MELKRAENCCLRRQKVQPLPWDESPCFLLLRCRAPGRDGASAAWTGVGVVARKRTRVADGCTRKALGFVGRFRVLGNSPPPSLQRLAEHRRALHACYEQHMPGR